MPDGTQEFPFNRRLCVRPVRNVNDRLLHAALNDVERIAANKDVDLTLREFCRPSEECGDKVMVGHTAALKVLRRYEIIGQTMKPKPKRRRNLRRIARDLRPLDIDMDGRVEECVFTVRPLDRLHDAALTRFLDEKSEGIIHHPPFYTRADRKRIHGFKLDIVGETEFTERHGKRANPPLPELCIGQCMRNLYPRICKNTRLFDKSPFRIYENRTTAANAPLCVTRYRDLLYDPNIAQSICMNRAR